MKIYILRKSISDIKTPIVKREYETEAITVRDFITEMVTRNYATRSIKETLENCIGDACYDFEDGCIYIVNTTQDVKYFSLGEDMKLRDGDELMIIKLKYVRGIIW